MMNTMFNKFNKCFCVFKNMSFCRTVFQTE